mmetsp:Transcript_99096/g.171809  ORF Transcript_99096/g.171809 Transcript_99096/m.171809 type:complete len:167 (+) Transcript_99096:47-547(+)
MVAMMDNHAVSPLCGPRRGGKCSSGVSRDDCRGRLRRGAGRQPQRKMWGSRPAPLPEATRTATASPGRPARRVSFNLGANAAYEITPYAEVYGGLHPSEFFFERDDFVVLLGDSCRNWLTATQGGGLDDGEDENYEEDECDGDSDEEPDDYLDSDDLDDWVWVKRC